MLGLTLAIWGLAVLEGWHDGVFAKLADGELAALAIFAFAFAPAAYFLDRNVRGMEIPAAAFAAALVAALIATALGAVFARDIALLFAGPVALAVGAAAIDRALRNRPSPRPFPKGEGDSAHRLGSHLSRARP